MLHVSDFENRWSSVAEEKDSRSEAHVACCKIVETAWVLLQKKRTPGQKHRLHVSEFGNRSSSSVEEKDSRSEAYVACCRF